MNNLKILMVALCLLGLFFSAQAQSVGINADNSTPNSSAMLDVRATNKGLLIPNVTLTGTTDATTITTPAVSLLVYNTVTVSNVTPGYYYNSGTTGSPVWARLLVTNANLTGAVTSTGNATSLGSFTSANLSGAMTDETGTGVAVFATSPTLVTPTLVTPVLGVASATTLVSGAATANASAVLDATSTTKGFLPPRMTYAQKIAISSPAAGLIVWCSDCSTSGELQVNNGTTWTNIIGGAASVAAPGAPTIGTAAVSGVSGTATVAFTAPASNGGATITSYVATSTPGNLTGTLSQAGSGTITITGLTDGTSYSFIVTAANTAGVGAASASSNTVTPFATPPARGEAYQGGRVGYIFVSGDHGYVAGQTHGLIVSTGDLTSGAWGNTSLFISGTSVEIGYGNANTDLIIAGNTGTTAASRCRAYSDGVYHDWYLASLNEMIAIRGVPNVTYPDGGFYWTSSDNNAYSGNPNQPWEISMANGSHYDWYPKSNVYAIRPVRSF